MPSTYTLIAANTLATATRFVTFSAIPSTFTDLVLRLSTRNDSGFVQRITPSYNGDSASNYSSLALRSNGSTASSVLLAGTSNFPIFDGSPGSGNTANTFSSIEIYIPSYTAAQNKPASVFNVTENNAASTNTFVNAQALLYRNTAAITSILLTNTSGSSENFVVGSSFYLYGISKS